MKKNREKKQEEKGKAREMKIGFIGMGNMAKAMIGGILAKGKAAKEDIIGSAKTEATRKEMAGRYGIRTEADNREVAKVSDLLVLAVKPQFFEEVISQIRKDVRDETIVVSIAAGRTIEGIEGMFGRKLKLVRCMPNTPALVGEGCSGVCRSGLVTEEEMARCMELVESFGLARERMLAGLCFSVHRSSGGRGGCGGNAQSTGIYLCGPGGYGKRKADAGDGKASGRAEGYGVLAGGNHHRGSEGSGGERLPGSGYGCGEGFCGKG